MSSPISGPAGPGTSPLPGPASSAPNPSTTVAPFSVPTLPSSPSTSPLPGPSTSPLPGPSSASSPGTSQNNPFNVYNQINSNLVNYSGLYYTPTQLPTGTNQVVAYADALVTGVSPAYMNSPTLPGNRYFLNTATTCADSASNVHTRSVLVDNVLQSSVNTLGKTSSGQNTGLLYSLLASLNNIGSPSSSLYPGLSSTSLPVVSAPSSASPSPATGYLNNTALPSNLPLCVPVSVYIDGTNSATTSGWVTPNDQSNIDPLAISNRVEGFADLGSSLPPLESAGTILSTASLNQTASDLTNHVTTVSNNVKAQSIANTRARYMATYTAQLYPFLTTANVCSPGTTLAPDTNPTEMLYTFINYVSPTQSTTMPMSTVIDVLKSTVSLSGAIEIQPFVNGLIQAGNQSQQNLLNYLSSLVEASVVKPSATPYLLTLLPSWTPGDSNPTENDDDTDVSNFQCTVPITTSVPTPPSTVPGTPDSPVPPQYIVNPEYVSYQNQYIQYQNQYTRYQNKYLYYYQTYVYGFVPSAFNLVAPENPYGNNPCANNPYVNNPYSEYIPNPAYCSFISALEVLRKPIIDAFIALDVPSSSSNTPALLVQESYTDYAYAPLDDDMDWITLFYYGSLTLLGLYLFYCIYRKHTPRFPF